MWSDNEADVDLLGFHHIQSAITSIIGDETLLPATIGVYGDWGSGKSSLMRMVRDELEKEDNILVLSFNGWLFEGYDDAKTALMGTIVDEIIARRTIAEGVGEQAKRLGVKLLKKIQVFRLLGMGTRAMMAYAAGGRVAAGAVAAGEGVAYASDLLKTATEEVQEVEKMNLGQLQEAMKSEAGNNLRRSIREFRAEFAELLKTTEIKTLVVFIDDLDRCMPDTIIETLEAIKLFLFVPRTAFVIGVDDRLVRYAVKRRFPPLTGEKVDVGQDYLEKLIQYPIWVPPLGRAEMETYINLLFTKKAGVGEECFDAARRCVIECKPDQLLEVRYNHGIAQKILGNKFPKELADNLSLAQRIAPVLAVGLTGNPRQCKRFLNTLVMRSEMAKSRSIVLKPSVLAKLMLLERFYSETYKQLAKAQAEQAGKPAELAVAEEGSLTVGNKLDRQTGTSKSKAKATSHAQPAVRTDLPDWLADPALKEWLASEPLLADEDLRPYFFFSRDKLGSLGSAMHRMSPAAQEMIALLFQEGKAQLLNTLKRAPELGPGDAVAVFQALAERARQEDDPGREESSLWRILDWMAARRELFGQGISLLSDLPEGELPVSLPPRIAQVAASPEEKVLARRLLEKWGRSPANDRLKNAAFAVVKKL